MNRGRVPSVSSRAQHTFARSPDAQIPRSTFDRSHGHKTTFNEGFLIPVFVDEVLPGDTFSLEMIAFARLATPIYPIMDNLYMETFFFFVPNRLLWDHWEQFNGFQANPGDTIDYTVPQVTPPSAGWAELSLGDYFGLPTKITRTSNTIKPNALHFRAYNLVWNDWFRDQNMQNSVPVPITDGPDVDTDYVLLQRGKRYDYFTSCLPSPQRGSPVSLPLGSQALIKSSGAPQDSQGRFPILLSWENAAIPSLAGMEFSAGTTTGPLVWNHSGLTIGSNLEAMWPLPTDTGYNYVDLSTATAANINDIRLAFQTQKLLERDARGGTRYTEVIRAHFGVQSADSRLQRPEYLGGGSTPVIVNPVAQTTPATTPTVTNTLGNLAAYGTVSVNNHGFTKSFTEHGVLVGLMSVRADLNYQQGQSRMWNRQIRYDFYWPVFSHLGEQGVLNVEIFSDGTTADSGVFGYQEAWGEYRYKPSLITGKFRSNASAPLDAWHLAQDFMTLPTLNSDFIVEDAPMARIKAVTSEPDFLFDGWFKVKCARPMPVFSVPGLIDHF